MYVFPVGIDRNDGALQSCTFKIFILWFIQSITRPSKHTYSICKVCTWRILFIISAIGHLLKIGLSYYSNQSPHKQGSLPLTGISVCKLDDTETRKNAFEISGPMIDTIVAVCQTRAEADNWVGLLQKHSQGSPAHEPGQPMSLPQVRGRT